MLRHDTRALAAIKVKSEDPFDDELNNAGFNLSRPMLDKDPADLAASLQRHRAAQTAFLSRAPTPYYRATLPTSGRPMEAKVLSALGRHAEAADLIAKTPLDCYDCVRVRGSIAKGMGNRAEAQRWYLAAAQQGPRLAPAFLDWGRLLLENR